MQKTIPPEVKHILKTLASNGFKACIAGGAVRDMLLGCPAEDFDIVTTASNKDIQAIFKDKTIKTVGNTFHICLVNAVEVASCRSTESNTSFPETDLGKRDFTINSMAWDPLSQTIIDPFSGRTDLAEKIIRFTQDPDTRISEDPLRMIRACRFAAKINGSLDPEACHAIQKNKALVPQKTAFERIRMEILKAMVCKTPSVFFRYLRRTGLLAYILPSLDRCFDLDGGPHHGETVFDHCLLTGDALSPKRPLLRLAGFLHDIGKYDAAEIKDGQLTFPGHEKKRQAVIEDLQRLKFSIKEITYIDALISVHMRPLKEDTTPKAVRKILARLEQKDLTYQDFLRMRIADKKANLNPSKRPYTLSDIRTRVKKFRNELFNHSGNGAVLRIKDLAVTGKDIMDILDIPQGPRVGEVMAHLFEKVLEAPELNQPAQLRQLALSFSRQRTRNEKTSHSPEEG
ncbi:MAG: CCA tRNA nucleotidyltransferase [Thermodesulfobacteriota bacterium]|nr:CCA tRNA nucleotidyltransferase [Thermodesulfobacteriota bacterium]